MKIIRNMKNKILAKLAALTAIPVNPKMAAIIVMMKKNDGPVQHAVSPSCD